MHFECFFNVPVDYIAQKLNTQALYFYSKPSLFVIFFKIGSKRYQPFFMSTIEGVGFIAGFIRQMIVQERIELFCSRFEGNR